MGKKKIQSKISFYYIFTAKHLTGVTTWQNHHLHVKSGYSVSLVLRVYENLASTVHRVNYSRHTGPLLHTCSLDAHRSV